MEVQGVIANGVLYCNNFRVDHAGTDGQDSAGMVETSEQHVLNRYCDTAIPYP